MNIAVYIHIPYCLTKCGYCSFYSVPYSKSALDNYVATLKQEISLYLDNNFFGADTIYFGGGTPSLLSPSQIRDIIGMFDLSPEAEITLEVNPVQLNEEFLSEIAGTGVNRLSLGVQSMNDSNLILLGRKHKAASLPDRIRLCRKHHFDNISVDFMYGLPGICLEEVKADLLRMLELKPEHISTYLLTLDAKVPFADWKDRLPEDDETADQYDMISDTLIEQDYIQYEISSFAQPGFHSRHNMHYWLGNDFIGLGAGASSCIHGHRFANEDNITRWKSDIEDGEIAISNVYVNPDNQKSEFIIMQMRLLRGVDLAEYSRKFNSDLLADYRKQVDKYISMGFLEIKGKYLRFTRKALFVSNHILSDFV